MVQLGRLEELVDPGNPRSYPDAARELISARMRTHLPDLRPEHSVEPEPPPEPTGTFAYSSPGGDLTGDGLADVLVWEITLPRERLVLRALQGTDGQEIWHRSFDGAADAFAFPVDDLTGDGIDDLVVEVFEIVSQRTAEDCPSASNCRAEYETTFAWHVGVRSGHNGSAIWTKRYEGRDFFSHRNESQDLAVVYDRSFEQKLESSNWLVLTLPSGDHDGDGRNDLVVDGSDFDWHLAQEYHRKALITEESAQETTRSSTHAEVVRGTDGHVLAAIETEKSPKVGIPWPVGDMVGDEAPDLLWDSQVIPDINYSCRTVAVVSDCPDSWTGPTFQVEVLDGRNLNRAWQLVLDDVDLAFSRSLEADISGDGAEDIWMSTSVFDDQGRNSTLRMVSGANGDLLWEREGGSDWETPLLAAPLGGGPGPDVLLARFGFATPPSGEQGGTATIRFARVEGATGATLFETTRHLHSLSGSHNGYYFETWAGVLGDVDGDGTADVYVSGFSFVWDFDPVTREPNFSQVGSSTFAESARTGTVLHEAHGPDIFVLQPAPDLDGDGRSDAFEWHYPSPGDAEERFEVKILRLAPTTYLWGRTFTADEFYGGGFGEAGDQDGRAGDEILYDTSLREGGHYRSVIDSLEGATGRERWRVER